jgi:hypothetical protein
LMGRFFKDAEAQRPPLSRWLCRKTASRVTGRQSCASPAPGHLEVGESISSDELSGVERRARDPGSEKVEAWTRGSGRLGAFASKRPIAPVLGGRQGKGRLKYETCVQPGTRLNNACQLKLVPFLSAVKPGCEPRRRRRQADRARHWRRQETPGTPSRRPG